MLNGYIEYYRKRYRMIPTDRVSINSHTPVGDEAIFYERKAHNGKRAFYPIFKVENSIISRCFARLFNYDAKCWEVNISSELVEFCKEQQIEINEFCKDRTHIRVSKETS